MVRIHTLNIQNQIYLKKNYCIQEIAQTVTYEDLTGEQARILKEELEEYRLKRKVGYHKTVSGQAADL
jgi:hypothetical protein